MTWRPLAPLLPLLLLALALRLAASASAGAMNDEAFTFYISSRPLAEIAAGARPDNNPPGYYVLLHPLARLTSQPEVLRLPSVLFGLGSVIFVFLAGRESGGPRAGPGAALAMACAFPVWLADSQIRQYGLLTCAATAALWLALRGLRQPLSRGALVAYGVACAAMPLASYAGFLLVGALGLGTLQPGPERRRLPAVTAASLLPGLAWLGYALAGPTRSDLLRTPFGPPGWTAPLEVPAYLTGLALPAWWPWTRAWAAPWAGTAAVVLGVLLWGALAAGVVRLRRQERSAEATLLACVLGLPLAAFLAVGLLGAQPFQPRYLVPVAGAAFLLLFAGVGRWAPALAALLAAVNLATAAAFPADPFLWNQDWPGAARWIEARQRHGDVVAVCLPYSLVGLDYSYARDQVRLDFTQPGQLRFVYAADYRGLPQVALPPAPPSAPPGSGRVFLVLCPAGDPSLNPLITWFNERYTPLDVREQECLHSWGRISVYLLAPR